MIIGPNFVWTHFPKCAGTFTERLLQKLCDNNPSIVFDKISQENIIWHQSVRERGQITGVDFSSKDVLCNFRRLPYWIISRILFEKKRSGIVTHRYMYSRGYLYEKNCMISHADNYLRKFLLDGVKHWIRVEYLQEDFLKVFSTYIPEIINIDTNEFKNKINTSSLGVELEDFLSNQEIQLLYESCPFWTELELKLYGDILIQ